MVLRDILVLGSGGREHAITRALHLDRSVGRIYCCPGNAGTDELAENVDLELDQFQKIARFAHDQRISYTIVGPEVPLAEGIVDYFNGEGLPIIGPSGDAANLESSKVFARYFMKQNHIPQPKYKVCDSRETAWQTLTEFSFPVVVKADGLAAGKGVLICSNKDEFSSAVDHMFSHRSFGNAGDKITLEECLIGDELSVFAICDGNHYKILGTAQDHKRIFDNDQGPNTGGMGAYSPTPLATVDLMQKVEDRIIIPTLKGMKELGTPFKGFLFAGIMVVQGDPYVIEFNVRLGDPESQVILPLLKSSFSDLIQAAIDGKLDQIAIHMAPRTAVAVVLATEGYPGKYPKGMEISGLEKKLDGIIFHAGTARGENNTIVTNGGRVLTIVGIGDTLRDAILKTYKMVHDIHFEHMYYRKDIGQRGLTY